MIRQFYTRQFLGFLLAGGIAAAVNFGSRIVFSQWMDFSSAVIFAYLVGMVTAFVLARAFVFTSSQQSLRRSGAYFALVNIVAAVQTWVISMALAYYLLPFMGINDYVQELAHGVGVIVPVFTSYLGHKHWSFR